MTETTGTAVAAASHRISSVGAVTMDPVGMQMKVLGPDTLLPAITPTSDHFMLAHLGIARCNAETWSLTVSAPSGVSARFTLDEIKAMPATEIDALLECAGNPEDGDKPTRIVGNARWRGASLARLLDGVDATGAKRVWLHGEDWGEYAGDTVDAYVKDLPLDKALSGDVLIAYEMNGEPLTPEHGFPLRAIVPGYYATNSVKWLSGISLRRERPEGLFTTRLYNAPTAHGDSKPVWEVSVNARLLAPADGAVIPAGPVTLLGRAWGDAPVERVDYSVDGGMTWRETQLNQRIAGFGWQTFEAVWIPPGPGPFRILLRATDATGASQPADVHINQRQGIDVTVASAG